MKRILLLFCVTVFISACNDDSPETVVTPLTGNWKVVAVETTVNGTAEWKDVPVTEAYYVGFNTHGEVLDAQGYRAACAPASLRVNGELFKANHVTPLADNGVYVLCSDCTTWDIELAGDTTVITRCGSPKMKFVRE